MCRIELNNFGRRAFKFIMITWAGLFTLIFATFAVCRKISFKVCSFMFTNLFYVYLSGLPGKCLGCIRINLTPYSGMTSTVCASACICLDIDSDQ